MSTSHSLFSWAEGAERAAAAADGQGGGEEQRKCSASEIEEIKASDRDETNAWSSSFHARTSHSTTTPRSRQGASAFVSPKSPHQLRDSGFGLLSSPLRSSSRLSVPSPSSSSFLDFGCLWRWKLWAGFWFPWGSAGNVTGVKQHLLGKRKGSMCLWHRRKRVRGVAVVIGLVLSFFFLLNWWMLLHLQDSDLRHKDTGPFFNKSSSLSIRGEWSKFAKGKRPQRVLYTRLLALAAHALAEGVDKPDPKGLWEEPLIPDSVWTPCAHHRSWQDHEGNNGYILVSANGGINQQRVAEDHFMNYLKADIRIVKELPLELQSLDLEVIGSLVTDEEYMKEAKPSFYLKNILPILLKNRVVHFIGFGNRLAFDPIPSELQRLRCRCNFHALQFVPKIQETGALLIKRMRQHSPRLGPVDRNLLGSFAVESKREGEKDLPGDASSYLALHLRFEIDMVAHSMCDFGGGEEEREELDAYRAIHFPALTLLKKSSKLPSSALLRSEGKCPLTPEEAVLMLAALGFNRKTLIFLAGAHIYGGKSRMAALTSLYPNFVTKEDLLSSTEIRPFVNFSSQLAALDFIGCAAADAFAMTDSGSQLSSLVSGYRIYYGEGRLPTIRPNKRRLAGIFLKNATMEWEELEESVRKAVRQSKKIRERPVARSIYRHPRCLECMCNMN
ncbi:O-fucosyltransferase 2-like isoform X2 [Magnolia sinica]|uniref:O-fucosyltransferase 2-like isoform X2 n=1 Tax=Magnolia sinica TaxID=86752 RepID=UPI002657F595|nr:O-fucosyltransferase 2-like isoform X2 [Magnolia sinica]